MILKGVLLATAGILAFYISEVQGLKCFQCNSVSDPGCLELTNDDTNSTYLKECPAEHDKKRPFCRRTKYTILDSNSLVRMSRECGWTVHRDNHTRCYDVDTDFKYEVNCQCFTDACNGALARFSRSHFPVFLALAVVLGIRVAN